MATRDLRPLCGRSSFKADCAFGFWKGSLIPGANGRSAEAMELNEKGIPSRPRANRQPKPEAKVPNDQAGALNENAAPAACGVPDRMRRLTG